ncbi:MAG TPA: hypothetical protein VI461_16295 [Chitinophagaceae bacterium]|nr:hypothetical protein [Chitinophagaceae bacterium]
MNKQPDLNKKVDEALNSLDGIQRAEPQPFFYTRLTGRMQGNEKTFWETVSSFLSKPVIATASLCVILAFNAFFLFKQNNETNITPTEISKETLATDNEYILASNSSFDYENFDQ